jgi:carboxyl-terminal processing protease
MPDIFVPLDTSANYIFYNQLVRRNILNSSVLTYLDSNREGLQKEYPNFDDYLVAFVVDDDFVNRVLAEAEKEKIEGTEESISFAKPFIKRQAKAMIARDLFGISYYYQVVNKDDEIIQKAMDVLERTSTYDDLLAEQLKND